MLRSSFLNLPFQVNTNQNLEYNRKGCDFHPISHEWRHRNFRGFFEFSPTPSELFFLLLWQSIITINNPNMRIMPIDW